MCDTEGFNGNIKEAVLAFFFHLLRACQHCIYIALEQEIVSYEAMIFVRQH